MMNPFCSATVPKIELNPLQVPQVRPRVPPESDVAVRVRPARPGVRESRREPIRRQGNLESTRSQGARTTIIFSAKSLQENVFTYKAAFKWS